MQDKLIDIKNEAMARIIACTSDSELEDIRIDYFGKSNGKITLILKKIPQMGDLEKAAVGQLANDVKKQVEEAIQRQGSTLSREKVANIEKTEWMDVTMPGIYPPEGHLHALTKVTHDVLEIFKTLGYQVADGYEIESDYYNFTALNMPPEAPSRDTQATFHLTQNGETILRTQLSGMQVRIMEKIKPPMRVVIPGKVYRVDDVDASHGFEFWQLEGLLVDKNIKMTDLLGTMEFVLKKLFGDEIKVRFDATYFAFVEPGVQAFMSCTICKQKGCPFCKHTGWVEIMPAGMVHPNVLKAGKVDTKEYNGFAFCIGLGRAAVLKYQIDDLRVLNNPDLRILKQF